MPGLRKKRVIILLQGMGKSINGQLLWHSHSLKPKNAFYPHKEILK